MTQLEDEHLNAGRNIYAELYRSESKLRGLIYLEEKRKTEEKEKVEQDSIISPRRAGIRSRPIDPGKSAQRHPLGVSWLYNASLLYVLRTVYTEVKRI